MKPTTCAATIFALLTISLTGCAVTGPTNEAAAFQQRYFRIKQKLAHAGRTHNAALAVQAYGEFLQLSTCQDPDGQRGAAAAHAWNQTDQERDSLTGIGLAVATQETDRSATERILILAVGCE